MHWVLVDTIQSQICYNSFLGQVSKYVVRYVGYKHYLKSSTMSIPLSIPSYYLEMERATRQYHPRRYILPTSSTNIFQHSFYFRSICDWNALPPRLIDHDNIHCEKSSE